MKPFVSIIVPTYDRAHLLPVTIDSFLSLNYPRDRFEIIIADNNSTDATRQVVSRYLTLSGTPSVKYIFEARQGVHYARNHAARVAAGDILYFTDDDMKADPALLEELMKIFCDYPDVGCATGLILPLFEKDPPAWVRRCLWNKYLSLTEKDKPEEIIISGNDMVFSCHQAVRRDLFFQAGGFNPENTAGIWVGDGETGLNLKIKKLGFRFAYTSKSVIYHLIPARRMTIGYLISRIGNQGFCDAYTEYRTHRKKSKIIPLMMKRNTLGMAEAFAATVIQIARRKQSWHFLLANFAYFYKRTLYDFKLYTNEGFRKTAEIDDWIDHD